MKQEEGFSWGHQRRFNDFPSHFRRLFKQRVQKISLDTGFSCPNRDGSRGRGGCTYCNNQTFNPNYCNLEISINDQLNKGIEFFAGKYPEMMYLAYFQAYTNTYSPLENLKLLYNEALQHPRVTGLVVATRPDCVNEEILDFLQQLSEQVYVMVEYGVESHLDRTLYHINRGHTFEESVKALEATFSRNIHTCAHLILGLPGETYTDFMEQAKIISQLPVENLKLHQLQIHKGTVMAKQYLQNPGAFHLFSADEYVDLVVDYLEHLNPKIVVERFISQSPPDLLIAPRWGLKNFEFVAKVESRLKKRETWQGSKYEAESI